jgi:hypothetical protein
LGKGLWNETCTRLFKPEIMTNEELFRVIKEDIESQTEYLSTTDEDEIECISVENVIGILKRHLNIKN